MNPDDAQAAILLCLGEIAPEVDAAHLDASRDLREELDLDSMDFLRLVQAVHARTGVSIAESEYARVRTLRAMADYVSAHSGERT